jgi:GNAT superfamily N-acetyltransferase
VTVRSAHESGHMWNVCRGEEALRSGTDLNEIRRSANTVLDQMIEVRTLSSNDRQAIRGARLRSLIGAPAAFTSTFDRESRYREAKWRDLAITGRWFVADGEGLVGVDGWSGDPRKRELVGMWVAPSHRGRGIARQLLDQVKAWAASEGATTLSLGVREGNELALAAYLSMGLHSSGETMAEVDQPTKAIIVMHSDLGPA